MEYPASFSGSKIALFREDYILVYKRDNKSTIPFPGLWDLPGGGREGDETPVECVLREVHEEFGIQIPVSQICWSRIYPNPVGNGSLQFFFAGWLAKTDIEAVRFGDEGQTWALMKVSDYLQLPDAIKPFQERVSDFLNVSASFGAPRDTLI